MTALVEFRTATFSVTGGLAAQYAERGEMIPWSGTLVVEGAETGDRRYIEKGALTHRELPMPFMVQLSNPVGGDGHDGASLSGRIDTLERQKDGEWLATGFIDPTTDDGTKLALALDKQLIRGVSVDLDQVSVTEVQGKDGKARQVITAARIIGATATPFQAFAECEIALNVDKMSTALAASADLSELFDFATWDAELTGMVAKVWTPVDGIESLVAFAGSSIPIDPPLAWFEQRKFTETTPLTVLANGQVFGHIASWGTCHISFANRCVPVPHSNTNYAKFRCSKTLTAEGSMVRTGPIMMDTIHPDTRWRAKDAQSFYADTGAAVCDVVPYEDEFGIAIVGAMRPDVAPARMRAFRGSDISPDWRNIDGFRLECCALLAVNNSGFKLATALVASAGLYVVPGATAISLDPFDNICALVASGPMRVEPCCDECAAHAHDETVAASGSLDDSDRAVRLAVVQERFGVSHSQRMAFVQERFGVPRADRVAFVRQRFAPPGEEPLRNFRLASFARQADEAHGVVQFRDTDGRQARDDHGRWTADGFLITAPITRHGKVVDYGEGEWPPDSGSVEVVDPADFTDPVTGQSGADDESIVEQRGVMDISPGFDFDTEEFDHDLAERALAVAATKAAAAKLARNARTAVPGETAGGSTEPLRADDPAQNARVRQLFEDYWKQQRDLQPGATGGFTVRSFHVAQSDALVAFAPDQPRDYHGRWSDIVGAEAPTGRVARKLRKHGELVTADSINPGMVLTDWGDNTTGRDRHGVRVKIDGPHKVLSIEEENRGILRAEKMFLADLQNVATGAIIQSVRLHAKQTFAQPYVPGMRDTVSVYVPPPAVRNRRLGYGAALRRSFRMAFRDTDGRQARDDHGRWSDMGGEAQDAAQEIRAKAEANVDAVTNDIRTVVEANGGEMRGLRSRLKGIESLTRKIADKAATRHISITQSAAAISDAMRFTAVVGEGNYVKTVLELKRSLKAQGYDPFDIDNHWPRGDAYNGLHMMVRTPAGLVTELQVHTKASLAAKNKIHHDYEAYRDPDTPDTTAHALFDKMVAVSDSARQPPGVLGIERLIHRPYEPRGFAVAKPRSVVRPATLTVEREATDGVP